MSRLKSNTVLITAAGQGIGHACALAMKREGARVIATDINAATLSSLAAHGIETGILDVRSAADVASAADEFPDVDVLFNCAGFVAHGTILDCTEEQWAFSVEINLTGMYRMIRAFLPGMLKRQRGVVLNMSSVASTVIAAPNRFVYGTTKAGVIGLTKSVAADFVAQGIRCHAICPGTVESPSLQQRMRDQSSDLDAARAAFVARQPMGRIGRPEEIAALAVYLASEESSYSTGTVHVIDGGWSNT
jgi:2-keto-3-deoxy-L-fuconate dehydrogenase